MGSLPGQMSLRQGQYYAKPQNTFWRIMGDLFDAGPEVAYDLRVARLQERGIAVWDVCASARRAGSLDSAIDRDSLVINDFLGFFAAHPAIEAVAFNGRLAATVYARSVVGRLPATAAALPTVLLPSTSPAHAAMRYAAKLSAWSVLRARLAAPSTSTRPTAA